MRQVQPSQNWQPVHELQMRVYRRILNQPPTARSSLPQVTPPSIVISEQERHAESENIKNLPSIWILMAQEQSKHKISAFRQKIESMYRDNQTLKKKCIIYPGTLKDLDYIFQKQRPVNIFIYSNIITESGQGWDLICQKLSRGKDYIDFFYVKLEGVIEGFNDQQKTLQCKQKLERLNTAGLKIEIVKNFEQAEKMLNLYNFDIAKDKSNFLNLKKVGIHEIETIGNFHHILFNTRSFLQQSLQMNEKKQILSSYDKFKRFMKDECENYNPRNTQENIKRKRIQRALSTIKTLEQYITQHYDTPNYQRDIQISKREAFYKKVLEAYVIQSPIYSSVNRLCKTITNKEIFDKIAFYCKFLYKAIQYFYEQKKVLFKQKRPNIQDLILYRLTVFGKPQLDQMRESQGDLVVNLSFNSSSHSKQVALRFISNSPLSMTPVLLVIKFHPEFYRKSSESIYEQYIQLFVDINLTGISDNQDEQQVLFNIFNIFKIIKVYDSNHDNRKITVIQLEYCSHIDLITKRLEGKASQEDQKLLNNIMRFEKSKDAFEQLRDQGKKEEMLKVIHQKINGDVELKPDETIAFTQAELSMGNSQKIEEMLQKIEKRQNERAKERENSKSQGHGTGDMEWEKIDVNKQILKAICNSHLQNNIQSVIQLALAEEPEDNKKSQNEQKSIQEYLKIIQTKLLFASMQEKINSYHQCFTLTKEVLNLLENEVKLAIAQKIINTFIDYVKFIRGDSGQISKSSKQSLFFQTNSDKIDSIINLKSNKEQYIKLKELLDIDNGTNEVLFLVQISEHLQRKVFAQKLKLERQLESYKDLYYQRNSFLLKLIQFELQLRIKSQSSEDSTTTSQKEAQQSFQDYFKLYANSFKHLKQVYQKENSESRRFEKALFFEHYSRFINAKLKIVSYNESDIKEELQQRDRLLNEARETLRQSNKSHNYLFNLELLGMSFLEEEVITEKKVRLEKIKSAFLQRQYSEIRISQQTIKQFRDKSDYIIKKYQQSNSNLSQNMIRNTWISLILERINSNQQEIYQSKDQLEKDLSENMNKFEANSRGKPFLQNHSSTALNMYLKAVYFFYKGCSEAANIYLQSSQNIIRENMKKGQKQIDESLKDEKKKKIMNEKLKHYSKTKDIIIKITLLKAKLSLHYKSKFYKDCLIDIREQIDSIEHVMPRYHTTLLDLCSAYLGLLLFSGHDKLEQYTKFFQKGKTIAIFYKIDNTLEYFKLIHSYLKALQSKNKNHEHKQKYQEQFERLAKRNKIIPDIRKTQQLWQRDKLDYYIMYSHTKCILLKSRRSIDRLAPYYNDIWICLKDKRDHSIPILVKELNLVNKVIQFYLESNNLVLADLLNMTQWLIDTYQNKIDNENNISKKLCNSFVLKDKSSDYAEITLYKDYKQALNLALKISRQYYHRDPTFVGLIKSPHMLQEKIEKVKKQYKKLYSPKN